MEKDSEDILKIVRQTQILLAFKRFADTLDKDSKEKQIINTLLKENRNKNAIIGIFRNRFDFVIQEDEADYMHSLVEAYMKKSGSRNPKVLSKTERTKLLEKQDCKCAFCGCEVNTSSPVDHIIPFKYVGDELKNNYQILCKSCNSKKNKQLTYQLEIILKGGTKNV